MKNTEVTKHALLECPFEGEGVLGFQCSIHFWNAEIISYLLVPKSSWYCNWLRRKKIKRVLNKSGRGGRHNDVTTINFTYLKSL